MSVEIVSLVRSKYPTPLGARHAEFLIECARALGAGLLKKEGGTFITLPAPFNQNVAQDIMVYKTATGADHYDVLQDGEGIAAPTYNFAGPVDPARYFDVGEEVIPPVPEPPAPPLPIPAPVPQPPARPRHAYGVHTPLGLELGTILGSPGSPYVGNAAGVGECVAHLIWKVQFEGYSLSDARENARKRARNEPAD